MNAMTRELFSFFIHLKLCIYHINYVYQTQVYLPYPKVRNVLCTVYNKHGYLCAKNMLILRFYLQKQLKMYCVNEYCFKFTFMRDNKKSGIRYLLSHKIWFKCFIELHRELYLKIVS
jgi:hypothetical protein